ncbi:MAG: response regulator [Symploca sp. SIO1C2]|nr:response regulator [Symploca sp. SIO1C2]
MPLSSVKILLIEDNLAEARLLQEVLKGSTFKQFSLMHVQRLRDALELLNQDCFDVILLDLSLPDSQGLASLAPLINRAPSIPIVVLTNTNDDELAIEAVRQGAQDYLVKRQISREVLVRSVSYAIERKQTLEALREVNETLEIQVQEQTAELVKAQKLNQLKSEFVSMLSHDFRNPLNTILLSTGLLQETTYKLTKEKKLNHFRLIRSAISNMTQLLDEVLLIGKADSGRLKFQPTLLVLEQFCYQLIEELQLTIGNQHQLLFSTQGELGEALWDKSLIRHILGNLLDNAIKYSPEGGTVLFELILQEQAVIFRIQDQGIGIPREYQKRIFDPFIRADNVDVIDGTGLGLAMVNRCVEVHGGQISVESEVDVGTTFIVNLPVIFSK